MCHWCHEEIPEEEIVEAWESPFLHPERVTEIDVCARCASLIDDEGDDDDDF